MVTQPSGGRDLDDAHDHPAGSPASRPPVPDRGRGGQPGLRHVAAHDGPGQRVPRGDRPDRPGHGGAVLAARLGGDRANPRPARHLVLGRRPGGGATRRAAGRPPDRGAPDGQRGGEVERHHPGRLPAGGPRRPGRRRRSTGHGERPGRRRHGARDRGGGALHGVRGAPGRRRHRHGPHAGRGRPRRLRLGGERPTGDVRRPAADQRGAHAGHARPAAGGAGPLQRGANRATEPGATGQWGLVDQQRAGLHVGHRGRHRRLARVRRGPRAHRGFRRSSRRSARRPVGCSPVSPFRPCSWRSSPRGWPRRSPTS